MAFHKNIMMLPKIGAGERRKIIDKLLSNGLLAQRSIITKQTLTAAGFNSTQIKKLLKVYPLA